MEQKFKTVLITGATRGIGLALCEIFSKGLNFEKIYMGCRSIEQAQKALDSIGNPKNIIPLVIDVADENSVKQAFKTYQKIKESDEKLDILINNAAAQLDWVPNETHIKSFDIDIELLDKIYRTNVFSHLIVTRTFISEMTKGGRVVNVASGSGEFWDPNAFMDFQVGYATSKSAAIMMSKKIAAAAQPYGVFVNSCCPGWCKTSMGGAFADTTPYDGAKSIIATCFLDNENPPTGQHWRYGKRIMLDVYPSYFCENCSGKNIKKQKLHNTLFKLKSIIKLSV